jgi:hypothetical protein
MPLLIRRAKENGRFVEGVPGVTSLGPIFFVKTKEATSKKEVDDELASMAPPEAPREKTDDLKVSHLPTCR